MITSFDPFDPKARREASKALTLECMETQILSILRATETGMPGNVIRQRVSGRKTYIDLALRSLWAKKLISASPRQGRGGGVIWRAETTRLAQPRPNLQTSS